MGEARSEMVKVRVTPQEKRVVEAAARAVGAKVSEFARDRLLGEASGSRGGPVGGGGRVAGGRDVAGSSPVQASRRAPESAVAPLAEPRRNEGPYACPTPLCQKRGARGELCPRHGVPMTFKL